MIELIESKEQLEQWTKRDIYSIRVLSLLESYGTRYHFAMFYRQIIDGRITAILSKLDNDVTLALDDGFDNAELLRFFCITGHGNILCDPAFQIGARFEEGMIMKCDRKFDKKMQGAFIDEYPKLMDLYNFVDYGNNDFKAWYVDISHRIRHNTAKAYTLNVDDNIKFQVVEKIKEFCIAQNYTLNTMKKEGLMPFSFLSNIEFLKFDFN